MFLYLLMMLLYLLVIFLYLLVIFVYVLAIFALCLELFPICGCRLHSYTLFLNVFDFVSFKTFSLYCLKILQL